MCVSYVRDTEETRGECDSLPANGCHLRLPRPLFFSAMVLFSISLSFLKWPGCDNIYVYMFDMIFITCMLIAGYGMECSRSMRGIKLNVPLDSFFICYC